MSQVIIENHPERVRAVTCYIAVGEQMKQRPGRGHAWNPSQEGQEFRDQLGLLAFKAGVGYMRGVEQNINGLEVVYNKASTLRTTNSPVYCCDV